MPWESEAISVKHVGTAIGTQHGQAAEFEGSGVTGCAVNTDHDDALEAQVAMAEQAGERDLSDVWIDRRRCGLQHREPALDLVVLIVEPFRLVAFGRPEAPLQ